MKLKKKRSHKNNVKIIFLIIIILIAVVAIIFLNATNNNDIDIIATEDYSVINKNSVSNQIDVLANDVGGDLLSINGVSSPSHGSATTDENYIYYTPLNNFSGIDSFEYTVNNENGGTTTSKLNVIVSDENPISLIDTSFGMIVLELYEDEAPKTCENFIKLANDGFYDGMIFHRIMNDFMIQTGRYLPDESEKQSPYGNIDFEGGLEHFDGVISMASTGTGVGGSSEFFICDGAQHGLDGNYAVFGKTIYGIEVVRDIADEPEDGSYGSVGGGKPYNDIIINSVRIENN
ncbi:MAG: peptidylprolyl isomerase [Thermoplasmatales archaeon]|nr:MAG: peptidylprolyl isomerase [Thermoplasmatales archaeon]